MKGIRFFILVFTLLIADNIYAQQESNPAFEGPVISFTKLEHDFGKIEEGSLATHEFAFTNVGKRPLVLMNVVPSCGCTAPEWSKDSIPPGGRGVIKAVYNSYQRPGPFDKFLTVKTNSLQGDIALRIKGDAIPKPVEPVSPVINKGVE